MAKKLLGILLCIILLPLILFNILLIIGAFSKPEYNKTLIIFIPTFLLLVRLHIFGWRLFCGKRTGRRVATADGTPVVIRCHSCGGKNTITDGVVGQCKYCFAKLRRRDQIRI